MLSGIILTSDQRRRSSRLRIWLMLMQGAGLVAALLHCSLHSPRREAQPARARGRNARYFDELRQRQRIVATISGMLGLLARFGGMLGEGMVSPKASRSEAGGRSSPQKVKVARSATRI